MLGILLDKETHQERFRPFMRPAFRVFFPKNAFFLSYRGSIANPRDFIVSQWGAYWRLLRLNKPVGILLLWYPTAWALWIANQGIPSLKLLTLFFVGTLLMRSAGCVINDIADRDMDKYVTRTKMRPLTTGELGLKGSLLLLLLLLGGALVIALNLPIPCFYLSLLALLVTCIYPFCKRFLNAPQFVLGIAFSMSIPMAYVASGVSLNSDLMLLFIINFAWIVAYDTMYAMTDKPDDLKIGIKSTAIYFADYDRLIIGMLQLNLHILWLLWAVTDHVNPGFYAFWGVAAGILVYQQWLIKERMPQQCFKAFMISACYGMFMWIAIIVGLL